VKNQYLATLLSRPNGSSRSPRSSAATRRYRGSCTRLLHASGSLGAWLDDIDRGHGLVLLLSSTVKFVNTIACVIYNIFLVVILFVRGDNVALRLGLALAGRLGCCLLRTSRLGNLRIRFARLCIFLFIVVFFSLVVVVILLVLGGFAFRGHWSAISIIANREQQCFEFIDAALDLSGKLHRLLHFVHNVVDVVVDLVIVQSTLEIPEHWESKYEQTSINVKHHNGDLLDEFDHSLDTLIRNRQLGNAVRNVTALLGSGGHSQTHNQSLQQSIRLPEHISRNCNRETMNKAKRS
jgi:hypothetical protein